MTATNAEAQDFPSHLQPRYDESDVARILCVSVRTVQAWRQTKRGPAYVRIGGKIRYTQQALLQYLDAHTVRPS